MYNFSVIFDNGGGATLQTKDYCHYYDDAGVCAVDVKVLLDGGEASEWDGFEPFHRVTYNREVEANGGYAWHTSYDIKEILAKGILEKSYGHNMTDFYTTLGVKVVV